MESKNKKLEVATFRFGVIADFVNGTRLDSGERERLLLEKVQRVCEIPFSKQQRIARSTT